MEEPAGYQELLAAALEKKAGFLEDSYLPDLSKKLRSFQTLFEGLYNILLRKSLIQEDPYQYDHKITEVTIPAKDPLIEADKKDKLSRRLSEYATQLDFLNHTYQFSLNFLQLDRIKPLVALITYFDWLHFNESPGTSTTGAFAEALTKVRVSGDSLSTSIVNDSVVQITATIKHLIAVLKEVTLYQREVYKLELRSEILPLLPETASPTGMTKEIKTLFFQLRKSGQQKRVFYGDLVEEIVAEDTSAQGQQLREEVLRKLAVPDRQVKAEQAADYRTGLLEGIRFIAVSSFHLDAALRVLRENMLILETQNRSILARLKRWLQGGAGSSKRRGPRILEISYEDAATSSQRTERIDFTAFVAGLQKRARLLGALANQTSAAYQHLQAAPDDQMYEFLHKNLQELRRLHNRMTGLNIFFKTQRPRDPRKKYKGIKIELSALKNSIVKSNKKLHEYLALKEEEEQMAKLGLKS
jgi:hypothetical protein